MSKVSHDALVARALRSTKPPSSESSKLHQWAMIVRQIAGELSFNDKSFDKQLFYVACDMRDD